MATPIRHSSSVHRIPVAMPTYQDKSAPSLNPLPFNLEKCDELPAFDTPVFGSTPYNRHTGVPELS